MVGARRRRCLYPANALCRAMRGTRLYIARWCMLDPIRIGGIAHVDRNHTAHYSDHRAARRLQWNWRWAVLRNRILRRRWARPGTRHRADSGIAWTDMSWQGTC